MLSFIFLVILFYLRFIPISIFWRLYFLFYPITQALARENPKRPRNLSGQILAPILMGASYCLSFAILVSPFIAVLNYLFQDKGESLLVPILLISTNNSYLNFLGRSPQKDSLFSFLLSDWFCNKKKIMALRLLVLTVEILASLGIIFGSIEVFNDYNSHRNPDIFDFLFPDNGAAMFWGGIAIFFLTHFYLYFLAPASSTRKWKTRLLAGSQIPAALREFTISRSLLHPYFFLSSRERGFVKENNVTGEKLNPLLEKAFRENRSSIPIEWLEQV